MVNLKMYNVYNREMIVIGFFRRLIEKGVLPGTFLPRTVS